jgi:branched-chain amino acid transport system substrate-binding protein
MRKPLKAGLVTFTLATLFASAATYAQSNAPIKVGFMLPASGTYASLGTMIENGFKLYVDEQGGKLGGHEIQYFKVDDESDPAKATDNVNKLIKRDKVDVLVGTVHSGVALAMAKVARETNTLMIVPNAGADAITGALCAKNIFRTSFTNWQPAYAMGKVVADRGHKKAITITWNYAAGLEAAKGFVEGFEKNGGKVTDNLTLPFPNVEYQALLTQIASQKPDAVFAFFAGGGAVKFVKDYAAAGLNKTIPLYGPGFLTDGTLEAQGAAAQGILTTLHYGDNLTVPRDKAFRLSFAKTYKTNADVYAVQGYDAAQLLDNGIKGAGGDIANREQMLKAMRTTAIDSPRGKFMLSAAQNPVQDIYLREVKGNYNVVKGVAIKSLADPALGCKPF